jgi:hypothetical protein
MTATKPRSKKPTVAVIEQAPEAVAEVLSLSQLYTFMDCPARWMFAKLRGLPDAPNSNLAKGSAVHEALLRSMAEKVITEHDMPIDEVLEVYRAAWDGQAEQVEFAPDENPEAIRDDGARLVEHYMREAAPKIQPAAVEVYVRGEIGGVKVQGHVDLLCDDGTIRDIKTAKRSPSEISGHNMLQLTTYEMLTPGASGRVVVDTLVANKTPKLVQIEHTITPQDRLAPERIYPIAQATMRAGYYMPNRTSNLCSRKNCAHWRACEAEFGGCVKGSEEGA